MNPKTSHAEPSGSSPESESGAAQRPKVTVTEADYAALYLAEKTEKAVLHEGRYLGGKEQAENRVKARKAAVEVIAQHTRAEVRKAVEPLVEALETVIGDLEGYEDGAPDASAFSKTVNATLAQVRSALSAHRARESQEGSRGPAESKTE